MAISSWRDRAACKGERLELFFGPGEGETRENTKEKETRTGKAKTICRRCPVRTECLEWHLQVSVVQHGVAGGLDEAERTSYLSQQRDPAQERRTP
ncbi:WhiB family transcriptional regulator [Streptosporangium sp. NPDC020072]|uniref:WhiB family transcriptional regulator n=1 Tax=Streptosporangium sp. NPDC020072 TaxID=3154788 RepID=UPI00341E9092